MRVPGVLLRMLLAATAAAVTLAWINGAGAGSDRPPPARGAMRAGGTAQARGTSRAARPKSRRSASRAGRHATPLRGEIVGIDPGHNGRNWSDPALVNRTIFNGRNYETCDTTGTQTDAGYTESRFNFNVARYLTRDLQAEGARVVLTRHSNTGVGPCVTTRTEIINRARANVAIDIHADGGPPGGRGFAILTPVADRYNRRYIHASARFARTLRAKFLRTGMPISTYDGVDGLQPRDDLAGLNLATEPKVLIECGNMRNATDAAMLVAASFQRRAARAMAAAITAFLHR